MRYVTTWKPVETCSPDAAAEALESWERDGRRPICAVARSAGMDSGGRRSSRPERARDAPQIGEHRSPGCGGRADRSVGRLEEIGYVEFTLLALGSIKTSRPLENPGPRKSGSTSALHSDCFIFPTK